MPGAHVFCWDCASHATVPRVASNLRCRCGSSDIDLYDPESEGQRQRIATIASLRAPQKPVDFVSFHTDWLRTISIHSWPSHVSPEMLITSPRELWEREILPLTRPDAST